MSDTLARTPPPRGTGAPTRNVTIGNSIPIDISLLEDIERSAEHLSAQLDAFLHGLQAQLREAGVATLASVKLYEMAVVDGVCGEVQACVDQTTTLISRCDEMDKDMGAIVDIAAKV
ncbi:hypothetical protein DFQ27_007879 [Actinomortierella ambigua]|uniref:BLOC-1-related complex subunit 6 C-terminal helix domain-containing protein n=1 Tax=Actinomortierella ambigua TaxID=1343610 RepID=A0A9P6PRV4_9FUNG|nr:hypothetical protein DFQ27_007879 [Actinomortierella ambigua]